MKDNSSFSVSKTALAQCRLSTLSHALGVKYHMSFVALCVSLLPCFNEAIRTP